MGKAKIDLLEYQDWVYTPWQDGKTPAETLSRIKDGIVEETGEVYGKMKKAVRDDWPVEKFRAEMQKEIGDVMFYWAMLCNFYDFDLDEILVMNVDKLEERLRQKTINGEGDDR